MIHHICAITGMASLKTNGTYVIATADQLKTAYPIEWAIANPMQRDPMMDVTTDFYMCSFVNASQIADSLNKLFNDPNAANAVGVPKLQVVTGPMQQVPTLATPDTSGGTGQSSAMIKSEGGSGGASGGSSGGGSTT